MRICDTRANDLSNLSGGANQCDNSTDGMAKTLTFIVNGLAVVPAGAKAVVVNLTAVTRAAATYLTVFPGSTQPLWPQPGRQRRQGKSDGGPLSPTWKIFIYDNTGSVDVVVDVLAGSRNRQAEGVDGGAPTITMVRFS